MNTINRSTAAAGTPSPRREQELDRRTYMAFVLALPGIVLAAACGGGPADEGPELATRVDTVGSVVRVSNTGDAPEWELVPVVSIGPRSALESNTPEAFGSVYGIAFGAGGDIFVADGLNREVRVFGPAGQHLRTFGRQGEGPGESATSIPLLGWEASC